ncbi:MAG: hypothetical protein OEU54_01335 [Gemmatimonadota bacterium]|nr:hypothetical protein [Gemmatimonadota bacterium]
MNREHLKAHIEAIEKGYEFFLAYAAQGAQSDEASKVGAQLREFLGQMGGALDALAADLDSIIETEGLEPADLYRAVTDITSADAARAAAAVHLVTAQDVIPSEMIDNLNASLHIRALLTDLFLLDDVV